MTQTYLKKKSMRIAGHRTSLALEPEFWAGLEVEAKRLGVSLPTLVASIDDLRAKRHPDQSLASAARVHVLDVSHANAA